MGDIVDAERAHRPFHLHHRRHFSHHHSRLQSLDKRLCSRHRLRALDRVAPLLQETLGRTISRVPASEQWLYLASLMRCLYPAMSRLPGAPRLTFDLMFSARFTLLSATSSIA